MDKTLEAMTKQELLARRPQDETRMAELDPEKRGNSLGQGSAVAHRHSRYLNEYQNLEAEIAAIDALLK